MRSVHIILYITAPSKKEAADIVSALIKKRLVACGNIISGIDSIFTWNGKTERAKEVLILCKSKAALFKKIVAEVKRMHSYEVPEIIASPITEGSPDYLSWISGSVAGK